MIEKIKDWWDRLVNGVRNFIIYAPVIWSDRNYDYTYIYRLLEVKLLQMKKGGMDKRIDICINLLPILKEEYVEMNSYYDSRYRFVKSENSNSYTLEKTFERDDLDKFFEKHRAKERIVRKKLAGRKNLDNYTVAMFVSALIEEQAKRVFFRTLERKIDWWWN
jgi:hypothetical protein